MDWLRQARVANCPGLINALVKELSQFLHLTTMVHVRLIRRPSDRRESPHAGRQYIQENHVSPVHQRC